MFVATQLCPRKNLPLVHIIFIIVWVEYHTIFY